MKECKKSADGFHCWHRQGWTSNPHNDDEKCCHCGQGKKVPRHGPYAPDRYPKSSRSPYDAGAS